MRFFQSGLDLESNNSIHCLLNEKWLDVKYSGSIHNYGKSGFRCDSFLIITDSDSYLIESVDESILGEFGQLVVEIYKLIVRRVRSGQNLEEFRSLDCIYKFDLRTMNEIERRHVQVIFELDCQDWIGEEISLEVVWGLIFHGKTPLMFGASVPGSMFIFSDMEDIRGCEEEAFRIDILGKV
jgi:hypothetical protein